MSGTNVWTRSRERMRRFPDLFSQCAVEAAAYGKCVTATTTGRQDLRKDLCVKEFDVLKTCFITAKSRGTVYLQLLLVFYSAHPIGHNVTQWI
uniref:NADH:ubiquinone oxidoreductase complex assembly factor 8 n=1 Tax=Esox lucius TaxID=8010 RepID=A0A6Q2XL44_ESOLU